MSLIDVAFNPGTVVFLSLAAISIIAAILAVEHKSLIYAALFLGILGMANAALFVMLGFSFIALFFVAVYIGAAVTFILFSVTMFQEAPKVERPIRVIAAVSIILTGVLLVLVFFFRFTSGAEPTYVSYRDLASLLTEKYGFALIIAALTLITTLIEGITIARREKK